MQAAATETAQRGPGDGRHTSAPTPLPLYLAHHLDASGSKQFLQMRCPWFPWFLACHLSPSPTQSMSSITLFPSGFRQCDLGPWSPWSPSARSAPRCHWLIHPTIMFPTSLSFPQPMQALVEALTEPLTLEMLRRGLLESTCVHHVPSADSQSSSRVLPLLRPSCHSSPNVHRYHGEYGVAGLAIPPPHAPMVFVTYLQSAASHEGPQHLARPFVSRMIKVYIARFAPSLLSHNVTSTRP